jgi:6-pyruvoyltetrahydropterin/6-carboxytetrahydropterin synthase
LQGNFVKYQRKFFRQGVFTTETQSSQSKFRIEISEFEFFQPGVLGASAVNILRSSLCASRSCGLGAKRPAHGAETFVLKEIGLLSNLRFMPRRFSIEVAKDYFNFASAHFLIFANGRREPLHGHNYQVSVAMEGELDRAGVVLDFITFKPLVKQVCDALDHRTLIQANSAAIKVRKNPQQVTILYKKQRLVLPRGDVILLPIANTSTELLAEYIARQIKHKVRRSFTAKIRYMEVAVEEARGQRGILRDEF